MFRRIVMKMDFWAGRASHVLAIAAGIITVAMIFTATYGVIRRYVFHRPEPYSYELSMVFMVWSFVLAVPVVEVLEQHIRTDIFIQFAPKRVRNFLARYVTPIIGLFYCSLLTYKGVDVAIYSFKTGDRSMSVWAIPLFPVKVFIPIGFAVLTFVVLTRFLHNIVSPSSAHGPKEELEKYLGRPIGEPNIDREKL
jgi:TRAP-type C4-dicarboxylate transport system permease small subunit